MMEEYSAGTEIANRFVILEQIGAGGMGCVYKALQLSLDREVALKVLRSGVAFTSRARRRFGREARAVARLNHPHIASVFDFGTDDDDQTLWLAMELVEGVSMTSFKREPFEVSRLVGLTDQILAALGAAHARGIVHMDLKPSNILLAREHGREVIKLVDFGLASPYTGSLSLDNAPGGLGEEQSEAATQLVLGTPRYMAPEVFQALPVDPRADLYSLGIILFELLSGNPPFSGNDAAEIMKAHLSEALPPLLPKDDLVVPPRLERCIRRLLSKEPLDRFQDVHEVREAIEPMVPDRATSLADDSDLSEGSVGAATSGFSEPEPAIAPGGSVRWPTIGDAFLVGRSGELDAVEDQLRLALEENRGSIIILEGESGIGKSSFAHAIRVRVDEEGKMRSVVGVAGGGAGGIEGVLSILESLLGVDDLQGIQKAQHIRSALERWSVPQTSIERCIGFLVHNDVDAMEGDGPGDLASDVEEMLRVSEQVLRHASRRRPLFVVLENLRAAGPGTARFLEEMARGLPTNPDRLVILGTLRTDEGLRRSSGCLDEALNRMRQFADEDVVRLPLKRLSLDDSIRLIGRILPMARDLARDVAKRAGGNPLFVIQFLRYLHDTQQIERRGKSWALVSGVDLDSVIPSELVELMRSRAEQAYAEFEDPEAIRLFAQHLTLIGRRFHYELLENYFKAIRSDLQAGSMDGFLEHLVHHHILADVGHGAEDILEFHHSLMLHALKHSVPDGVLLADHHRVCARVKIEFFGGRVHEHAAEIKEHFRLAGERAGAYVYCLKAANHAMEGSRLRAALKFYRQASRLLEAGEAALSENLDDAVTFSGIEDRSQIELQLAHLERRLGESDAARARYRRLLRDSDVHVGVWSRWGMGVLSMELGEHEEARGWFDAVFRIIESSGADEMWAQIRSYALFGRGEMAFLSGQYVSSQESLHQALRGARRCKDNHLEIQVLRTLSDVSWRKGNVDQSEVYRRRSWQLATREERPERQAEAELHLAQYLHEFGDPKRAEEELESASSIFEEIGKTNRLANCALLRSRIEYGLGNLSRSRHHLEESKARFELHNDKRGMARCAILAAELSLEDGDLGEARSRAEQGLDSLRKLQSRIEVTHGRLLMSRIELASKKRLALVNLMIDNVVTEMEAIGDLAGIVTARAFSAIVSSELGNAKQTIAAMKSILALLGDMPITRVDLAKDLEQMTAFLSMDEPALAMDVDREAARIWCRLGRVGAAEV